jgi:hypothetical protein
MCPFDSALTARLIGWRLEGEDTAGTYQKGWRTLTHLLVTLVILGILGGWNEMGLAVEGGGGRGTWRCSQERSKKARSTPAPRLALLIRWGRQSTTI